MFVRPRLCFLTLALLILTATHLRAQTAAAPDSDNIIPNRYIIVYRNTIPGDAEGRSVLAGARLLERHDRLGIATVQTPTHTGSLATPRLAQQAAEDDQATMRRLASQPNVEYVFHDRIVTAHRLHVRPIPESLNPTFSVVTGPAAIYDTYYNSPQGWAVRQAGGYGNSIPGGSAVGPWDTTTGKGVRIAILDSGIDAEHPDLSPNLALNLSEVDSTILPSICDDGSPRDQDGHGTWTASLAAAALGPGTGRLIGVAPSATLLNIKVLERMPLTIPGANETARCTAGGGQRTP